jgi:hypothetical protein
VREALLLDLGAIIFELHRQRRREPELLHAKAAELDAVDAEVRALALALDDGRGLPELTASGLVATCTACGSLMGSADRFCPRCGAAAGAVLPASENGAGTPELQDGGPGEIDADPPWGGGEEEPPTAEEEGRTAGEEGRATEETRATALEAEPPTGGTANCSGAVGNGSSPRAQDDLVRVAQSKMRAGRRVARRWLAQRRPEAQ